jgi:hypothetical protein
MFSASSHPFSILAGTATATFYGPVSDSSAPATSRTADQSLDTCQNCVWA